MNINGRQNDWFVPALIISLAAHGLVFLLLPHGIIRNTSTLIIRSMAFIRKDVVDPIRGFSSPEVTHAGRDSRSPTHRTAQSEVLDVTAAPPEKEENPQMRDKKLKLSKMIERRPGGKSDDSQGFLELIRERISASCEKHMEGKISIPGSPRIVVLSVTILPSGKLDSVEVIKSSNLPLVDRASVDAVKLAAPFPRFPSKLDLPRLKLRVPIRIAL